MGDRANIVVEDGTEKVCLYAHWTGSELPEILRHALIRAKGEKDGSGNRWTDFQYLTRIIFSEMIKGQEDSNLGYGISQEPHDGEDRILYVNLDEQAVSITQLEYIPFEEYIKKERSWVDN